jgi:hypothetical protein
LGVKASPRGRKVSNTSISTNKLGVEVHTYHPSYKGGIIRESQSRPTYAKL